MENNENSSVEGELKLTRSQITELSESLKKAKGKIETLEEYYKKFEELRAKLDHADDGLENNLSWSQNKKKEIDELKQSAETQLEQIKTALQSAQTNIETMNTAYAVF